jgi:hypothetical protein
VFRTIPGDVKQAITESLLSAWLDKTLQYPPTSYFALGPQPVGYKLATQLRNVSGGGVWEAASQFRAAGVRLAVIERLNAWGRAYTALTDLFHY